MLGQDIAKTLSTLNHKNLLNFKTKVKIYDGLKPQTLIQMVTECPEHISYWKCFCKKATTLEQTLSLFRQLTEGMHYIHEQGHIFRDMHPTRIHLCKGTAKINLVGMPYNFKKLLKNDNFSGHLNYSAPEVLKCQASQSLTNKVDIWSLGCCFYYLVTKRDPFDGSSP